MIEAVKAYLKTAAGVEIVASDVRRELKLTPMVASLYRFFRCKGDGVSFGLMLLCEDAIVNPTPAAIELHARLVSEQLGGIPVVYAAKRIVSYNRLRLLARRIPFVAPGRQLYLPFFNMVMAESGERRVKEFDSLGVAAQMILILHLNRQGEDGVSIADAVARTGYTRVSVMKAFDELEYFGFAMRDRTTHRLVFAEDRKGLFGKARPLMRNPKRRTMYLDQLPRDLAVVRSGTDALSDISMIAPGKSREYAALSADVLKRKDLAEVPRESAAIRLELWHYRPAFVYGDRIDPLSLCLSLADERDDRVQGEVEEVLEAFKW